MNDRVVVPINPNMKPAEQLGPNEELVAKLRALLADAECGLLRNFVGVGIEANNSTISFVRAGELMRSRFSLIGALRRLDCWCNDHLFPEDVLRRNMPPEPPES